VYQTVLALHDKAKAAEKADAARLKLARAYRAAGQKPQALNEVTKVLTREPDNDEARRLKAELEKK
jgi:Tfp pilus assembly protein PilF